MVGSLRRTTSVPSSGGEDNLSSRRRTVTGSGSENNDSKDKLPDILTDWEIIVKSLGREDQPEKSSIEPSNKTPITPKTKVPKKTHTPITPKTQPLVKTPKSERTDSDKENSQLKKKKTQIEKKKKTLIEKKRKTLIEKKKTLIQQHKKLLKSGRPISAILKKSIKSKKQLRLVPTAQKVIKAVKAEKFTTAIKSEKSTKPEKTETPSTSEFLFSPCSNINKKSTKSDTSPNDDSDINWRRPTRSTYKAFESIFESPELVQDLPKEESNPETKEEIEALKALFTPKKEIVSNKRRVIKKFPLRQKKLPTGRPKKLRRGKRLIRPTITERRTRGRPRKLVISENLKEKIKERRITRGLLRKKAVSERDAEFKSRASCKELYVKIETLNITPNQKMDFLGFGTPPSTLKKLVVRPPVFEEPLKEIIAEENLELSSDDDDTSFKSLNEENLATENGIAFSNSSCIEVANNGILNLNNVDMSMESRPEEKSPDHVEFYSYFNINKESIQENDFKGFDLTHSSIKTCLKCCIILESQQALRHHIKVAHQKIYPCPFDTGNCLRSKGAFDFHTHLLTHHKSLISFLEENLVLDMKHGKIAQYMSEGTGCGVCLMHLEQPMRCVHELLVHGILPPSVLNLSPVAIDQHVSLWWTGKSMAFACHLCHTPENQTLTIPIITSAPHCLPTLLSNHLRNVHLLNLPLIQGWYLMFKLLLGIPASTRRTLATTISLGVDSNMHYSCCINCGTNLKLYANMNLSYAGVLCKKCDIVFRDGGQCWFGCKGCQYDLLNHMISDHEDRTIQGWCISCCLWSGNLLKHLNICVSNKSFCKFCTSGKPIGMTVLDKVMHSLNSHSYFCPIPNCHAFSSTDNSTKIKKFFPSSKLLLHHLTSQHLPDWNKLNLEQISTMIFSSKKETGLVLSKNSAQQLQGTWIGVSGHQFSLLGLVLSPKDLVKVPMVCLLCSRKWEETVAYTCKEGGAICSECTLHISQYESGDSIQQCPVFKCLCPVNSIKGLYQHLIDIHKLTSLPKKSSCPYCGPVSLVSSLSAIIHNVLKHKIACLLCPFTAPTSAQIFAHRATMHGLPSWDTVFQHLKIEENLRNRNRQKPNLLNGIVRVWDGQQGTYSIWDQTLKFSGLIINDEEEDEQTGIINQSCLMQDAPQSATRVDQWCSSICSVSMSSPNKNAFETSLLDRDIKSEINLIEDKMDDSHMEYVSPNLLIPNINVGEEESNKPELFAESDDKEDVLEIDSTAFSEDDIKCNTQSINIPPVDTPTYKKSTRRGKQKSAKKSSKKSLMKANAPTFGLPDTLNSVMEESLNSMSQALSNSFADAGIETQRQHKHKKNENGKSLAENACFDEKSMAENILKDLDEKYCATCIGCNNSVLLTHLKVHLRTMHAGTVVHCNCGYKAELYDALVHSFHMSHMPNEARPIIFGGIESKEPSMIVLEARSDLKSMTYPCYKCFKRFKQEKSRQLHYNLCKLEKKFDCDVCGEKFALDNHLQKHKEWKHNPQVCKHCGKTFNSSSSLAQHVLHIHKKPLNHRCRHCGDAFNNAKQLKVHLRIHSGLQPHACKLCTNKFISRNLLQKHITKSHKKSDPYEKMNGASSSSDSSDSDDSDSDTEGRLRMAIDDDPKVIALTESDLNTSSSDTEDVAPPPAKKLKTPQLQKGSKLSARFSESASESSSKDSETKGKAGIYKDQEVVVLPEMRASVRHKVESMVGRVCTPCGQEFESSTAKLLHMYLIHPGLVLTLGFTDCSFCDHTFLSADDVSNHHLDKHQRTNVPNDSFRCLCGLVFREDGAYYFHLYYAHKAQRALNIGGEIVCRVCEGRPRLNKIVDLVVHLSDRHTMFDHVRFNDSYMCNFCYKAFESWTVLSLHFFMVHKATKSQTLSYDCPFCQGASPWHSLEALQYHLDNVHRGRHTQSRPVPEHSRSIYTPAPIPSSPTKKKEIKEQAAPLEKPMQMRHRGPGRNKRQPSGTPKSKSKKGAPQPPLYCLCQCPYDEVSNMIGCDNDNCKFQWFHFECVGIMAAPEGNWYCPNCVVEKQPKEATLKQKELQEDLYDYYSSNFNNEKSFDAAKQEPPNPPANPQMNRSRNHSSSSSSSNSSSSSSSNSSSSSSSSSDSSSASGDEN